MKIYINLEPYSITNWFLQMNYFLSLPNTQAQRVTVLQIVGTYVTNEKENAMLYM